MTPIRRLRPALFPPLLGLAVLALAGCGRSSEQAQAGDEDPEAREVAIDVAHAGDALGEQAQAEAEANRLEALWSYVSTPIDAATRPQRAASLRNVRPDDDDPASFAVVPTVLLVLRDDPRWGQSVYLVIEDGRFECGQPCAFTIAFDDEAPRRFAGDASSTGTRPALFIKDDADFIRRLDAATRVSIAPVDGRAAPIAFDVGGFNRGRYESGA